MHNWEAGQVRIKFFKFLKLREIRTCLSDTCVAMLDSSYEMNSVRSLLIKIWWMPRWTFGKTTRLSHFSSEGNLDTQTHLDTQAPDSKIRKGILKDYGFDLDYRDHYLGFRYPCIATVRESAFTVSPRWPSLNISPLEQRKQTLFRDVASNNNEGRISDYIQRLQ